MITVGVVADGDDSSLLPVTVNGKRAVLCLFVLVLVLVLLCLGLGLLVFVFVILYCLVFYRYNPVWFIRQTPNQLLVVVSIAVVIILLLPKQRRREAVSATTIFFIVLHLFAPRFLSQLTLQATKNGNVPNSLDNAVQIGLAEIINHFHKRSSIS